MSPFISGGDKRDRTADLLLARQALSQLSYTPVYLSLFKWVTRVPSKLNNVAFTPHPDKLTIGHIQPCFRLAILLRKEVIQPHVLVRLPCYDFTPIIEPTFGRALLKG